MEVETYRKKFYNHLSTMNGENYLENLKNIDFFKYIVTKYIILCKLSFNEIKNDDTIKSKGREIADYGLDVSDMIFSSLIGIASKYFTIEQITSIIKDADKIDCLHKDYVYAY